MRVGRHKAFGGGIAIGGVHYCGDRFAKLYRTMGLEVLIAANAENWSFFIEGHQYSREVAAKDPNSLYLTPQELDFFETIALDIPLHEPVHRIWDPRVVKMAAEETEIPAQLFAVVQLYTFVSRASVQLQQRNPTQPIDWNTLWTQQIDKVAKEQNIDASLIRLATYTILGSNPSKLPLDKLRPSHFTQNTDVDERLIRLLTIMTTVSNILAMEQVEKTLAAGDTQRTMAFFAVGIDHLLIVDAVFPSGH